MTKSGIELQAGRTTKQADSQTAVAAAIGSCLRKKKIKNATGYEKNQRFFHLANFLQDREKLMQYH